MSVLHFYLEFPRFRKANDVVLVLFQKGISSHSIINVRLHAIAQVELTINSLDASARNQYSLHG